MLIAYLSSLSMFFQEYWWLVLAALFGLLMFTGRRLDRIIDWLTERKMQRLYPALSDKYAKGAFDYDAYLSELLGVDIRLDALMHRIEEINHSVYKNEVVPVSYLELWIIVQLYKADITVSDSNPHVYYVNKAQMQKNIDIDIRELNRWVIEFAHSKKIRSLRVEASFILHKIRTKDPSCNPLSIMKESAVAAAVFERGYIFSARSDLVPHESSDVEAIEIKGGHLLKRTDTGWETIQREDERAPLADSNKKYDDKEDGNIQPDIEKSSEKNMQIHSIDSDGSTTYKVSENATYKKRAKIDALKSDIEKSKDGSVVADIVESAEETKSVTIEALGSSDRLFQDLFDNNEPEPDPVKFFSKEPEGSRPNKKGKTASIESVKNDNAEASSETDVPKEMKEASSFPFVKLSEPLSANVFLSLCGELYFDEESNSVYFSVAHLLAYIYASTSEKEKMISALYDGSLFYSENMETIVSAAVTMIGGKKGVITRAAFHRAEEGFKEVRTFVEIAGLGKEKYVDHIVRGKLEKRYKQYRSKVFAEQFLDLENECKKDTSGKEEKL